MIEIISEKGERYSYDPGTDRIFRDNVLVSSVEAEPVFSSSDSGIPRFSGIYLKNLGKILSLSGKYSQLSDPNTII